MPPKPKNTREEVAKAAFALIKEEGLDALSARSLGKRLNSSAGSLFTIFSGMDEIKMAARELALIEFIDYLGDYRNYTPPFKKLGVMVVSYGMHQPELFKLLFMQEHKEAMEFEESIKDLGEIYDVSIGFIMNDYGIEEKYAKYVFEYMWIQTFGLGAMCAMGVIKLTDEEVSNRLGVAFMCIYTFVKSGRLEEALNPAKELIDGKNEGHGYSKLFEKLFAGELPE